MQESPVRGGAEGVREFLERELPPAKKDQVSYLTNVLLEVGQLYDRHTARRDEWLNYAKRRDRLIWITKSAEALASFLSDLDILSRDDLAARFGAKRIEELIGSLRILGHKTKDLVSEAQKDGRPRELAEERWIIAVAEIYENAFARPARVWGAGAGPVTGRGSFYRLLEVSRPALFARRGKLSPRQIDRKLKGRRKNPSILQLLQLLGTDAKQD
jgi:hypothetical protein